MLRKKSVLVGRGKLDGVGGGVVEPRAAGCYFLELLGGHLYSLIRISPI